MKKRWLWLLLIAIAVVALLTLVAAPGTGRLNRSGSTYTRSPDGYGAWYAFMEQQGTPVQRWQKPFDRLPEITPETSERTSLTLLRVYSQPHSRLLNSAELDWVKQGNTLVLLGVQSSVTPAPFTTEQQSNFGNVKIETRQRILDVDTDEQQRLGDRFGAVISQQQLGDGQLIFSATPHLAANAYQDEPGNYKFLAQLVTQPTTNQTNQVWVDEYLHGYIDPEVRDTEVSQDWIGYLAQTPLFPGFVQVGVIFIILVIAQNRRFGAPKILTAPVVDNSEAYIQALASVLQKANSSEFVLAVVGKEEQLQLQKALGLGSILLDNETLVTAWVQQTGRPASELEELLKLQSRKRPLSENELLNWLGKWQQARKRITTIKYE